MKKGILIVLLFSAVFLGQIREDVFGGELILHANVINSGKKDANDLRVSVFIPDIGFYKKTNRFDLDDGEKTGKFIFGQLYNAPPGAYLAKITLSNSDDGVLSTKYVYILT